MPIVIQSTLEDGMTQHDQDVATLRAFNRVYTSRLGLPS